MFLLDRSFVLVLVFGLVFVKVGARGNGAEAQRAAASVSREHFVVRTAPVCTRP
jgi:hypothetical protein